MDVPNDCLTGTDSDGRMGAALALGPRDFKEMQAPFVADLATNAVRRLSHWVSMQRQWVIFLDKNIF